MTLPATMLLMMTWFVTRDLEPVYASHLRKHPLGAELRVAELAHQIEGAALATGVPVRFVAAVAYDESGFDHQRRGAAGELGEMQLLPGSPWFRGWMAACEELGRKAPPELIDVPQPARFWAWKCTGCQADCEALNVLWGARALRAALDACGGDEHMALGMYRTGKCVAGPRGARTLGLAEWLRGVNLDAHLQACLVEQGLESKRDEALLGAPQHLRPPRSALDADALATLLDVAQVRARDVQLGREGLEGQPIHAPRLAQRLGERQRPAKVLEEPDGIHGTRAGRGQLLLQHDGLHLSCKPTRRLSRGVQGAALPRQSVFVVGDLHHLYELAGVVSAHLVDRAPSLVEADRALVRAVARQGLVVIAGDFSSLSQAAVSHVLDPVQKRRDDGRRKPGRLTGHQLLNARGKYDSIDHDLVYFEQKYEAREKYSGGKYARRAA